MLDKCLSDNGFWFGGGGRTPGSGGRVCSPGMQFGNPGIRLAWFFPGKGDKPPSREKANGHLPGLAEGFSRWPGRAGEGKACHFPQGYVRNAGT